MGHAMGIGYTQTISCHIRTDLTLGHSGRVNEGYLIAGSRSASIYPNLSGFSRHESGYESAKKGYVFMYVHDLDRNT